MANYTINGERPWFKAKLAHALENLASFATFDVSATYVEAEIQSIVDALAELSTALKEGPQ